MQKFSMESSGSSDTRNAPFLVVGDDGGRIHLLDASLGRVLESLQLGPDGVASMVVANKCTVYAAVGHDLHAVPVVGMRFVSEHRLHAQAHNDEVSAVCVDASVRRLFTGATDGDIGIWDYRLTKLMAFHHDRPIFTLGLGPFPETFFVGDESGCCTLYDGIRLNRKLHCSHEELVTAIACVGEKVVIGMRNGICEVHRMNFLDPSIEASDVCYTAPQMIAGCAIRQRIDSTDLSIRETVTVGSRCGQIYHAQFPFEREGKLITLDSGLTCIDLTSDGEELYAGFHSGVIHKFQPLSSLLVRMDLDIKDYPWCQLPGAATCLSYSRGT